MINKFQIMSANNANEVRQLAAETFAETFTLHGKFAGSGGEST